MNLNELTKIAVKKIEADLFDDLNGKSLKNDITSNILISKKTKITAHLRVREEIVLCGIHFVQNFIFERFPELKLKLFYKDGQIVSKSSAILEISGECKKIFMLERSVINFLQHLSSISTYTSRFVLLLKKSHTKLLNTRKTITGLRKLQKYATTVGGAKNHRIGLHDEILIKDNHIEVLGGIDNTLKVLKEKNIKNYKIECETIEEVKKSMLAGAKYILLDNMSPLEIKKSIELKEKYDFFTTFEISGGINLKNFKKFIFLGADYISTGKITNSANSVDIGLDII